MMIQSKAFRIIPQQAKNLLKIRSYSSNTEYIKTTMTQLSQDEGFSMQITSCNEFGFSINERIKAIGPIIVFPKSIYSWNISGLEEVNEKSLLLFKILQPKADIIVIGTGDKNSKINPEVPKWLIKNKLNNFEILPTEKAINAFNFLVAEGRFVAGGFIPTLIKSEVQDDVKRIIDRKLSI